VDTRTASQFTNGDQITNYINDGRNLMEQNRGRTDFRKVNLARSPQSNHISSRTNDYKDRSLSLQNNEEN
jgi:hypothetical protein